MKPKRPSERRPHRGRENHAGSSPWETAGTRVRRRGPAPALAPRSAPHGTREQSRGQKAAANSGSPALPACHPLCVTGESLQEYLQSQYEEMPPAPALKKNRRDHRPWASKGG